jgi:hypothetical protein
LYEGNSKKKLVLSLDKFYQMVSAGVHKFWNAWNVGMPGKKVGPASAFLR